jgi:hypothetical protein
MAPTTRTTAWRRLGDAAKALGDAVATPRGAAPDRAIGQTALRREHS